MLLAHADVTWLPLLALVDPVSFLKSAGSLLLVILGFSFVVFVHELGHFLAAKWAGVRVEKFCIGFGKELFGFTRGETRYAFNLLPLGGYVKMLGQEDFAVDKTGEMKVKDETGSFTSKTVGQRMVIVSAGVVMNLIFAAVGLTAYMMIGYRAAPAVIGLVAPDTPASRAGMLPGDRILAINGSPVREFSDVRERVVLSDPGEVLELDIERDGRLVLPKPRVLPEFQEEERVRQVGMAPGWTRTVAMMTGSIRDEYGANELQPNDLMLARIGEDGRREPVRSVGQVWEAMIAARGLPVRLEVKRPTEQIKFEEFVNPDDSDRPGKLVEVTAAAFWYVHPDTGGGISAASLLGLVPRLRCGDLDPAAPAAVGGVESGDILTSFAGVEHPNYDELLKLTEQNAGRDTPIVVRRPRAANRDLSAAGVRFVAARRESWLATAIGDVAAARQLVAADLDASDLQDADRKRIRSMAHGRQSAEQWQAWLEGIDQHELTVRPSGPRTWFNDRPPTLGLPLNQSLPEDDRLMICDVAAEIGGRTSPAALAGVPRGAVILSVDARPVSTWPALTEALRAAAGTSVRLRYRHGLKFGEAEFAVPASISAALKLPAGARIQSINGLETAAVNDGGAQTVYLPDWRAVRALLKQNIGKSVSVKWTASDGVEHSDSFAVTADNADPWLLRVAYLPPFLCYPMLVDIRETNPFAAAWAGIRKTYFATWNTLQSIRHIAFTHEVGVNQLRGPVGIARIGMQIAESNWSQLLWFLCLISANLAVINSLPLPIVDGGLFFFLILEKVRGEPLSIRTQVVTQLLGIALIASVFLFVTFQDIVNWNK